MPTRRRNGPVTVPPKQMTSAYVERPPLRTTAETIPYRVEGPDGEIVTLAGYCRQGCPADIYIEWLRAQGEAADENPTDEDRERLASQAYFAKLMAAEIALRRGYLQAVIPGLRDPGFANAVNVLAGEDGQWLEILVELGWLVAEVSEDEQESENPEDDGETSLPSGPIVSPAGSPVTASTPSEESPGPA